MESTLNILIHDDQNALKQIYADTVNYGGLQYSFPTVYKGGRLIGGAMFCGVLIANARIHLVVIQRK